MTITAEQRQVDLVDRLAAEARRRVPGDQAEERRALRPPLLRARRSRRRHLHLLRHAPRRRAVALGLRRAAHARHAESPPLQPDASRRTAGVSSTPSIEIVNDDMPFLVDSVTAEIQRRERKIHLLLHPVIRTRRDADGNRIEVTDTLHAPRRRDRRVVHARRDRSGDRARRARVDPRVARADPRAKCALAVQDWRAMRARLSADVAELETREAADAGRGSRRGEGVPALARRRQLHLPRPSPLRLRDARRQGLPRARAGDGPGHPARDPSRVGRARRSSRCRREFSEYARTQRPDHHHQGQQPQPSSIARVPMDRIGIKRYDDAGQPHRRGSFPRPLHLGRVQPQRARHPDAAPQGEARRSIAPASIRTRTTARRSSTSWRPSRATSSSRSPTTICSTSPAASSCCRSASAWRSSRARTSSSASSPATSSCRATATRRSSRSARSRSSKKRSSGRDTAGLRPHHRLRARARTVHRAHHARTDPGRRHPPRRGHHRRGGAHVERPPARRAHAVAGRRSRHRPASPLQESVPDGVRGALHRRRRAVRHRPRRARAGDRRAGRRSLPPSQRRAPVPLQDHSRRPAGAALRDHAAPREHGPEGAGRSAVRGAAARRVAARCASATSASTPKGCRTTSRR